MDQAVNERDFQLLAQDRYTFSVLSRVLHGDCNCVRTDHQRFILCHTAQPYPVWLWTPDGISEAEKAHAWTVADETLPMAEGYRYNLKYELAEYFIAQAQATGTAARIATNMYAYDCPQPVSPTLSTDGDFHICTADDVDEAAEMIYQFHDAVHADRMSLENCRLLALQRIETGSFFFWKNAGGETVACASCTINDGLGCVGGVYTKPQHRRKHYAQHLVYRVTRMLADKGLMPMLYTDADYAASNACYEKIGYVLRGKLCTIAAQ